MNRYYSDVNNAYYTPRPVSDGIRASGWQSPIPTSDRASPAVFAPLIHLVVDCPFGSKKCDYTIDKSQRGRLIVGARRRHRFKSDYLLPKSQNDIAYQTFTIPSDADVDRLQSRVERSTNRLIIEIPRYSSASTNSRNVYTNSLHSTGAPRWAQDERKYSQRYMNNNQKVEYRVDCRGYNPDQLKVFVQGRDLIVQGKMARASSSDPTREHVSKTFSRKIPLASTADASQIASYFENGDLIIQAPLKQERAYSDQKVFVSEPAVTSRTVSELSRVRSPVSGSSPPHQQQQEHFYRYRAYDPEGDRPLASPIRRERSAESLHYPSYRLSRDFDDENGRDNRRRRTVTQQRRADDRNDSYRQPTRRSIYTPAKDVVTARTTYRHSSIDRDAY